MKRITWKRRVGIAVADIVSSAITLPACFLAFVMGAFASDSGTKTALLIAYSIIGFAGLYAIITLALVVLSQVRGSYKLALAPAALPLLFYIWIYLA